MKTLRAVTLAGMMLMLVAVSSVVGADDTKDKPKPYTLPTCAVCGMKLGEMGKPYTFVYKDREIKVCDKGEADDFKKEPSKYIKKIEEAEAKAKGKK